MTAPNTTATLHTEGDRPVLRFERILRQPPADVWRALTEPNELKAWFPDTVIVDEWKVGASLEFDLSAHNMPNMMGTVLEVDEPRVLSFMWGGEKLRFELIPTADGGTHLVMTDELEKPHAARNAAGWDVCLDALEGLAPSSDTWEPRFERYKAEYEPILGTQEGPPAEYKG